MTLRIALVSVCAALLLAGCVAKRLTAAGAEVTIVSRAPHGCQRLGEVESRTGGWVSGDVTSANDLDLGARNALRNEAAKRGADTVQIVDRDGVDARAFAGHAEPNAVHYRGVAWRCSR